MEVETSTRLILVEVYWFLIANSLQTVKGVRIQVGEMYVNGLSLFYSITRLQVCYCRPHFSNKRQLLISPIRPTG